MTYFCYVERQKERVRGARKAKAAVYLREQEYEFAHAAYSSAAPVSAEKLSAHLMSELSAMKGLNRRERELCAHA